MLFGHVGGDHQEALRVFQVPRGISCRRVSKLLMERLENLGPRVGGDIYVVGTHHRSRKLLGNIGVLVCRPWRRDEGVLPVLVVRELFGYEINGLRPGRLLQPSVPADHGRLDAVAPIDELHPELALEAALSAIRGGVAVGYRANQAVALVHFQLHFASDRAVWAYRVHFLDGLVPLVVVFYKRARGANVYARSAEFAARFEQAGSLRCSYQAPA